MRRIVILTSPTYERRCLLVGYSLLYRYHGVQKQTWQMFHFKPIPNFQLCSSCFSVHLSFLVIDFLCQMPIDHRMPWRTRINLCVQFPLADKILNFWPNVVPSYLDKNCKILSNIIIWPRNHDVPRPKTFKLIPGISCTATSSWNFVKIILVSRSQINKIGNLFYWRRLTHLKDIDNLKVASDSVSAMNGWRIRAFKKTWLGCLWGHVM